MVVYSIQRQQWCKKQGNKGFVRRKNVIVLCLAHKRYICPRNVLNIHVGLFFLYFLSLLFTPLLPLNAYTINFLIEQRWVLIMHPLVITCLQDRLELRTRALWIASIFLLQKLSKNQQISVKPLCMHHLGREKIITGLFSTCFYIVLMHKLNF